MLKLFYDACSGLIGLEVPNIILRVIVAAVRRAVRADGGYVESPAPLSCFLYEKIGLGAIFYILYLQRKLLTIGIDIIQFFVSHGCKPSSNETFSLLTLF